MNTINAKDKAKQFIENEQTFRLGALLTESSHPKTHCLSQVIQKDAQTGIRQLLSVDRDIIDAQGRLFTQPGYNTLVNALHTAITTHHKVFFTGCGATGRLSILLEAAWREFWQTLPSTDSTNTLKQSMEDRCVSVMAGGDFALIKSVEGFEDFSVFGRHQLGQAGAQAGDVVVAITEGGETPFVIGTAWEGLEIGAQVFFVYNNPSDLLCEQVKRSREIIQDPRITKLDLATGPMAIMGSTRMQATTTELLVVGAALEQALARLIQNPVLAPVKAISEYQNQFTRLMNQLSDPRSVAGMAEMAQFEQGLYAQQGLITYAAQWGLLDILTDTTERSPTFMVPPFQAYGEESTAVSWGFVKNPTLSSEQSWQAMLRREPRGLTWQAETYQQLGAPKDLQRNPPCLDNHQIHRFRIGNEPDPSRIKASAAALMIVGFQRQLPDLYASCQANLLPWFSQTALLSIGETNHCHSYDIDTRFHIPLTLPDSPLQLWRHLALKLILNTVSTATMACMGRVLGNAMVWVSPSNKKLIDRGCRLIVQVTGCAYDRACHTLFKKIEELDAIGIRGNASLSPVALAIEHILNHD